MIDSQDPADHVKVEVWLNFYADGSFKSFATKKESDDCMALCADATCGKLVHCLARTSIDVDIVKGVGL